MLSNTPRKNHLVDIKSIMEEYYVMMNADSVEVKKAKELLSQVLEHLKKFEDAMDRLKDMTDLYQVQADLVKLIDGI